MTWVLDQVLGTSNREFIAPILGTIIPMVYTSEGYPSHGIGVDGDYCLQNSGILYFKQKGVWLEFGQMYDDISDGYQDLGQALDLTLSSHRELLHRYEAEREIDCFIAEKPYAPHPLDTLWVRNGTIFQRERS